MILKPREDLFREYTKDVFYEIYRHSSGDPYKMREDVLQDAFELNVLPEDAAEAEIRFQKRDT